jgi:hypothetical protein
VESLKLHHYNCIMSTATLLLIDSLRCPISGVIMRDPVILRCSGVSYEREAIEDWIVEQGTDPRSGEPLRDVCVVQNPCMKGLIEAVVQSLGLEYDD